MVADAFEICACRPIGFQNKRWETICVCLCCQNYRAEKKSKGKSGLRKVNNLGCVSCDNEINR